MRLHHVGASRLSSLRTTTRTGHPLAEGSNIRRAVKRSGLLFTAALLVLLASSCGGDGDGGGEASSRCENVPPALVAAMEEGLELTGGGGSLTNAKSVKSNDFERVYFISADIDGPGLEGPDDIGTWAKSGPLQVGGGLILSVDNVAEEFSSWPDAGTTDVEMSMEDDGAEESKDCVEDAS
jgi:hypothetical protein